jgi:hypothetical protein
LKSPLGCIAGARRKGGKRELRQGLLLLFVPKFHVLVDVDVEPTPLALSASVVMLPVSPYVPNNDDIKTRLSTSYCASYQFNPRNLERPWYGRWNLTLNNLIGSFDNMIVTPQFPIWFDPGDANSDGEDAFMSLFDEDDEAADSSYEPASEGQQGSGDDEVLDSSDEAASDGQQGSWGAPGTDPLNLFQYDERDPDELPTPHVEDEDCSSEADLSRDSMFTIPDGRATERLPDFAIIHLLAKQLPAPFPRFESLAGLQITHQCCAVLVEVKANPSRKLRGRALKTGIIALLAIAREGLGYQSYHLFQKYLHAKSTIAIAAAGEYWTHRVILREEAPTAMGPFLDMVLWESLQWPKYVKLRTPQSDLRFQEIHDLLSAKPRLNLQ